MNEQSTIDAYGELIEPATLKIQRVLPAPPERVWAFLTESELRRRWLASGEMKLEVGAAFELVWRNDELTDPPGAKPEGFGAEHRMASRITELDPPRRLAFTWGTQGGSVAFELEPRKAGTLLTLIHRRLPDPNSKLNVSAGWHAHLDVLVAIAGGAKPEPFWDLWVGLKEEYRARLGL